MRLIVLCAATDAEFQNRIILHDNVFNLPVVAQQPHPDPNFVHHRQPLPLLKYVFLLVAKRGSRSHTIP